MLTLIRMFVKMNSAPYEAYELERYRSGHNEAVLKTVCPQGRVGSNPTLSAGDASPPSLLLWFCRLSGLQDKPYNMYYFSD